MGKINKYNSFTDIISYNRENNRIIPINKLIFTTYKTLSLRYYYYVHVLDNISSSNCCDNKLCDTTRKYINHASLCKIKKKRLCKICDIIMKISIYHCIWCRSDMCTFPSCKILKKKTNDYIKRSTENNNIIKKYQFPIHGDINTIFKLNE